MAILLIANIIYEKYNITISSISFILVLYR